jgi:hypothetical protein
MMDAEMTLRKSINFTFGEIAYTLWRLSDAEYWRLGKYCLPIMALCDPYVIRDRKNLRRGRRVNLAEMFVVLQQWFGESSKRFDDWKGSFAFPILMHIVKSEASYFYMGNLYDHRGYLDLSLYRITSAVVQKEKAMVLHQPFATEFSQEELSHFMRELYEQIKDTFDAQPRLPAEPFLKTVGSNLILYGHMDDEYFEQYYNCHEHFKEDLEYFQSKLPPPIVQAVDVSAILEQFTGISLPLPD